MEGLRQAILVDNRKVRYRHHIGHLDLPFSASPPNATKINSQIFGRTLLPELLTVLSQAWSWSQEDDDPNGEGLGLDKECGDEYAPRKAGVKVDQFDVSARFDRFVRRGGGRGR